MRLRGTEAEFGSEVLRAFGLVGKCLGVGLKIFDCYFECWNVENVMEILNSINILR